MAGESYVIPTDFIFLFIIRVVFLMIRVDPSPVLFYFYFVHSIRVGPSRSEVIRPGLAVRVDPQTDSLLVKAATDLLTNIKLLQLEHKIAEIHIKFI